MQRKFLATDLVSSEIPCNKNRLIGFYIQGVIPPNLGASGYLPKGGSWLSFTGEAEQ